MDEVGTPFCLTVDGETAGSQSVDGRHRDAMTHGAGEPRQGGELHRFEVGLNRCFVPRASGASIFGQMPHLRTVKGDE